MAAEKNPSAATHPHKSQFISRVSVPYAGVALGFAALGNLLQSYGEPLHAACGVVSLVFVVLLLVKIAFDFQGFASSLKDPIPASVLGTLPMACMLLATYAKPLSATAARVVWMVAVAAHILLILWFSVRFFGRKFALKKVFASYYIVYVGIVVASVTAPAFEAQAFGNAAFWFGLACFDVLFVLVSARYLKVEKPPAPARPVFCIYAAPASLCVAGYVQSGMPKSLTFCLVLLGIAQVIYIVALVKAPKFLFGKFYPSLASLTFPFVISAVGLKQALAMAVKLGVALPGLSLLVTVETVIALVLCLVVAVRFTTNLFGSAKKHQAVRMASALENKIQ